MFALRIDLREWETFFFGTARRKGGNSSSNDCKLGIAQLNGACAKKVGRIAAAYLCLSHGRRKAGNNVREWRRATDAMIVETKRNFEVLQLALNCQNGTPLCQ